MRAAWATQLRQYRVNPKARCPDGHGSMIGGGFTLAIDELGWTGQNLHRPESVVADPDGTL